MCNLMVRQMGKKQSTNDRHASNFMVRLPEVYRDQLKKLTEESRRSVTEEIKIAVEDHLKKKNLWPPGGDS